MKQTEKRRFGSATAFTEAAEERRPPIVRQLKLALPFNRALLRSSLPKMALQQILAIGNGL